MKDPLLQANEKYLTFKKRESKTAEVTQATALPTSSLFRFRQIHNCKWDMSYLTHQPAWHMKGILSSSYNKDR
jgi:hypothetical protein